MRYEAQKQIPGGHLAALAVLCERLPLSTVNWALTGSLGHRLQGVDVEVHDIDVQTDEGGAVIAAGLLPEYVVTKPYRRTSALMFSVFGELQIGQVPVELMGGIRKRAAPGEPWGPATDPSEHRLLIRYQGLTVPVLSLSYEAVAYEQIGRSDRASALRAQAMASPARAERDES